MSERAFWNFVRLCLRALWTPEIDGLVDAARCAWLTAYTVGLLCWKRYFG